MKKLLIAVITTIIFAPAAFAYNDGEPSGHVIRFLSLEKYVIDNDIDYAKAVIEHGACAQCSNDDGIPMIHLALNAGPQMIELLLDNGADINMQDTVGYTPLIRAVRSKGIPLSTVEFLLEKEAKIGITDSLGQNALSWTMHNSDVSTVKLLLDYVKEPSVFTAKDKKGDTALDSLLCYPPKNNNKDKEEKVKLMTDAMRKMGLNPPNSCKHKK